MDEAVAALRQSALLGTLPDEVLVRLGRGAWLRRAAADEIITLEGEPCQAVHFIVAGRVRVSRMALSGREQVLVELGPGQAFNTVPVFEQQPTNRATARALMATTVVVIGAVDFLDCVRTCPEFALALLRDFAARIERLVTLAGDLSLYSVRARLARFLLVGAPGSSLTQRWTQDEIAAHLGTVRDVVGRTLRAFADEGLVCIERQRIVLLDRERLQSEAEG